MSLNALPIAPSPVRAAVAADLDVRRLSERRSAVLDEIKTLRASSTPRPARLARRIDEADEITLSLLRAEVRAYRRAEGSWPGRPRKATADAPRLDL